MKIIVAQPPNIDEIRTVFTFTRRVIFAYDGNIYNPDDVRLTLPMIEHEKVHFEQQQKMGNAAWWKRYLADPLFRSEQEKPAYRAQYQAALPIIKNRHLAFEYAKKLAAALSGDTYGNCLSFESALTFITS